MHSKVYLGAILLLLGALFIPLTAWGASADSSNLVFILDASNSMNKPFGDVTRVDAAKEALSELLTSMPAGEDVGLIIYGNQINYKNEAESCNDISFPFPVTAFDDNVRSKMIAAISGVRAQGKTPLADSLTEAANALSATGQGGVIVLLSDGEGNCGGESAVVADMIAKMDPQITVYVVGLDIEQEAGDTLRTIADATNGRYWSVNEASGLLSALLSAVGQTSGQAESTEPRGGIPAGYERFGVTNVIYGTEGNDVLYGTSANDLIFGLGGDDFIIGLGGNDVLIGGAGNDIIEGMDGCDIISGGAGDDTLFGGAGDDTLCGDDGNDSLEGEAGNDVLAGGPGNDKLLGGAGLNLLYAGTGNDILMQGKIMQDACAACPLPLPSSSCPPPAPCSPPAPCNSVMPTPPTTCTPPAPPAPPTTGCCYPAIKTVDEGSTIQLHGTVTDSDCGACNIRWSAEAGSFDDPTSLDPMYTAPMTDSCDGRDVCVTLVATDGCGATGKDSFVLHIRNVNNPPRVNAGPDVVVDEGGTVQLAPAVSDPDGDALRYHWSIPCGDGVLTDATLLNAVYSAPLVGACDGADIVLKLTVIDSCGASAEDSVTIHVRNLNAPPIVELGPGFCMTEATSAILHAVASDPECGPLTYYWTASAGTFDDAFSATPCFSAPNVSNCDGEDIMVSLTVTDVCGASASDSYVIHVQNVNTPPVVKADP